MAKIAGWVAAKAISMAARAAGVIYIWRRRRRHLRKLSAAAAAEAEGRKLGSAGENAQNISISSAGMRRKRQRLKAAAALDDFRESSSARNAWRRKQQNVTFNYQQPTKMKAGAGGEEKGLTLNGARMAANAAASSSVVSLAESSWLSETRLSAKAFIEASKEAIYHVAREKTREMKAMKNEESVAMKWQLVININM